MTGKRARGATRAPESWQSGSAPVGRGSVQVLLLLALACRVAAAADPPARTISGTVVRRVIFERQPIFTESDRARLSWLPLAMVNRLHVDTQPGVIRRTLLFGPGIALDPESLAETERKLRELGIFGDVEVRAMQAPGDSVDVLVRTRELWTTSVDFSYDKFENDRLWSVQMREKNFLGMARTVQLSRDADVDRTSWSLGFADRQLFDGTWQGDIGWSDSDDGGAFHWRLARPFFRLTDTWSLETSWSDVDARPRYYLTSTRYVRPRAQIRQAHVGLSKRWKVTGQGVWRWGAGFWAENNDIIADTPLEVASPDGDLGVTASLPAAVPEDREWYVPALRLQRRTRHYEERRYLYAMGTTEDIPRGLEFTLDAGFAPRWLGSTESGLWWRYRQDSFHKTSRHWLHRVVVSGTGLLRAGGARDTRIKVQIASYHDFAPGLTLATSILGGTGSEVDRHRLFDLGLNSGLRAARFRELSGDRLLRANVEMRAIWRRGLYDLVTPGLVVFADYGTAWLEEETDFRWGLVRGSIGAGLRLGFNRGGTDVPIRIDLAWPLLYPVDQSSPILSIGTGHVF